MTVIEMLGRFANRTASQLMGPIKQSIKQSSVLKVLNPFATQSFKSGRPDPDEQGPPTAVPQSSESPTKRRSSAEFYNVQDHRYFDPKRALRYLVAMDFSENSERALKLAKQLIQRERGDLIVIHHVPITTVPTSFMDSGVFTSEFTQDLKDLAERKMQDVRTSCEDVAGRFVIEIAEPTMDAREALMKRLEEQDPFHRIDVVVCGHRGGGRLTQLMHLGSVANYLAMYSPCSLVLVR